jgi:hypothetical protein
VILLTQPTDFLELNTGSALSTDWTCSWVDVSFALSTFVPGSAEGNVAASMATTIAPAPAAGGQRQIKYASVVNRDVSTQTVYLDKNSGAAYSLTGAIPLAPGDSLQYVDSRGFFVLTAAGFEKFIGATGAAGTAGATGPAGQGPPGADGDPGEDAMHIPGPAGLQGIQGPAGSGGSGGASGFEILYQEISAEEPMMIPGPPGLAGAQGIPGSGGSGSSAMIILMDGEAGEDAPHIPGPAGPQGTAGSGGSGSANVTPDTHPALPTGVGLGPNDEFETGSSIDTTGTRYSGATAWTWFDQSTSVSSVSQGSVVLAPPADGGTHFVLQAAPAAPWTYRAKIASYVSGSSGGTLFGLAVANSGSSNAILYGSNFASSADLQYYHWNIASGFVAGPLVNVIPFGFSTTFPTDDNYYEIENDGTNLILSISRTGVEGSFLLAATEPLSSFVC